MARVTAINDSPDSHGTGDAVRSHPTDGKSDIRLAIRTVLVTYRAALRHSTDQAEVRQRAQHLLQREAIRIEPEADDDLRRLLDDARREIDGGIAPRDAT